MKKTPSIPIPPQTAAALLLSAAAGFGAGAVNGLLGTGGGILLLSVLRRHVGARDAFASALVCILPLSVLSVVLYYLNGTLSLSALNSDTLPFLLGAIPGGILGAFLLDKIKPAHLQLIFAALLLFSGWRMAFA